MQLARQEEFMAYNKGRWTQLILAPPHHEKHIGDFADVFFVRLESILLAQSSLKTNGSMGVEVFIKI